MAPFVTGEVNPAALEDLVRLCVDLDRLRHHGTADGTDGADSESADGESGGGQDAPSPDTARAWEALERAIIGKTVNFLLRSVCPVGLAVLVGQDQSGLSPAMW